jgi:hypothetical protein
MDINEDEVNKKLYVYNSIKKNIIDHEIIKQYIIKNGISYSKNNNGLFVNLSLLDDKYILELYKLIYNQINNKIYNEREKIINNLNYNNNTEDNNIKQTKQYYKQQLEIKYKKINYLSKIQLEIIEQSKTI